MKKRNLSHAQVGDTITRFTGEKHGILRGTVRSVGVFRLVVDWRDGTCTNVSRWRPVHLTWVSTNWEVALADLAKQYFDAHHDKIGARKVVDGSCQCECCQGYTEALITNGEPIPASYRTKEEAEQEGP